MIRDVARGGAYAPKLKAAIDVIHTVNHADKKSAIAANAIDVATLCKSTTNKAMQRIAEANIAHDHALNAVMKFRRM